MKVGELFAGIGGIGLGLERAGMKVLWAVENEPYAAAVYRKNFPGVKVYEQNIEDMDWSQVEHVEMLAGGFPCQDISYAGKGAGIDGERSGLWSEFWRSIRALRPRLILVENVPALLARGLDRVLGDLAALGYDAEWDCIPAAAVGAPHRRDRAFVIAHANCDGQLFQPVRGSMEVGFPVREWSEEEYGFGTISEALRAGRPECFSQVKRVDDGIPARVDRLRGLGNAVVPQVAEWIGRRIMEVYGDRIAGAGGLSNG